MLLNINNTRISNVSIDTDNSKVKKGQRENFDKTLLNRINGNKDLCVVSKLKNVYTSENYNDLIHNTIQKKCVKRDVKHVIPNGYVSLGRLLVSDAKDSQKLDSAKEYLNEKNVSDEKLEDGINEQESETKTDIIVKPDGSRVLVVTTKIGGMETTMSLEISKPTNELNDVRDKPISTDGQAVINDNLSENLDSGTFI